jgi:uncharacterized Zn finger protein (UPF0148 family)
MHADPRGMAEEANRLYWQSDTSVADIAAQLDLSRRALYDAVIPLPTDTPCPRCGAPLTYANRSARDSGDARCAICPSLDAAEAAETEAAQSEPAAEAAQPETAAGAEVEAAEPEPAAEAEIEAAELEAAGARAEPAEAAALAAAQAYDDDSASAPPAGPADDEDDDAFGEPPPMDAGGFEGAELQRRAVMLTSAALIGAAIGAAVALAFSRRR